MRNIGYRIRLPTELNEQKEFIIRYSCYFNTFEVKVKDNIICKSCINNIVMLAKRYLITVPSFVTIISCATIVLDMTHTHKNRLQISKLSLFGNL